MRKKNYFKKIRERMVLGSRNGLCRGFEVILSFVYGRNRMVVSVVGI